MKQAPCSLDNRTFDWVQKILPLDSLRVTLLEKYDLNEEQVNKSIDFFSCFMLEKAQAPEKLIVVPQTVDWVWHELILMPQEYERVTDILFGFRLSHRLVVRDDKTFNDSKDTFIKYSQLDLGDPLWNEAGWTNPAYRFSDQVQGRIREIVTTIQANLSNFSPVLSAYSELIDKRFDWLLGRVVTRFAVPRNVAEISVALYCENFVGKAVHKRQLESNDSNLALFLDELIQWSSQEHKLWTSQYEHDLSKLH